MLLTFAVITNIQNIMPNINCFMCLFFYSDNIILLVSLSSPFITRLYRYIPWLSSLPNMVMLPFPLLVILLVLSSLPLRSNIIIEAFAVFSAIKYSITVSLAKGFGRFCNRYELLLVDC